MWRRARSACATPMLFALGFIVLFLIGGADRDLSSPRRRSTTTCTTRYFIVAHFHYTLFAGSMFGLFAGVYYWWPKVTGLAAARAARASCTSG